MKGDAIRFHSSNPSYIFVTLQVGKKKKSWGLKVVREFKEHNTKLFSDIEAQF